MSDPVRIIVGSGESAEIRVASSSGSAEIRIPESSLIVGPPGPAGEDGATFFPEVSEEGVISWTNDGGYDNPEPVNIKGPAGNDGSDGEDGEDGVSPTVSFTTITGGHTMTVTDKDHPSGQSINIMDGESGGGGTTDYDDLTDKPSINNVTLSGNKTAADLGLGTYSKPSGGIPQTDLASAVQNKLDKTVVVSDTQPASTATENKLWVDTDAGTGATYQVPTVAEMEAADAQVAAEIGIVITGKRPSMAVTAGQFVIVRNSTISGISDGLYTANAALSPSTDVTAANLTVVSGGGLNYFTGNPTNTYITASVTTGEKISNLRAAIATVRGGLCQLYIGFDIGQAMATNELMFVLPEGFRPKTSADGLLVVTTNGGVARNVRINESGNITAAEAFTAATYNRLVGMYFI